jgi:hypothetical protein
MIVEIKQAIVFKIKELYPTATIYDEQIPQGFDDGSFFIDIIDVSRKKLLENKAKGALSVDLSYFPSDTEETDIRNECNLIGENLLREFDLVGGFRISEKTYTITDDVLHVQFKVKYREIKTIAETKMNDISFK